MRARWQDRAAIGTAAVSYLAGLLSVVLAYRTMASIGDADPDAIRDFIDTVVFDLAWVGFPAVGAVLAVRRPGNPIGWMLLLVGASMYVFGPADEWVTWVLVRDGEVGTPHLAVAGVGNAFAVVPVLAFALVLLGFPDGLQSRWSRWLCRVAVVATALATLGRLLRPGPLDLPHTVDNPFGIAPLSGVGEGLVLMLTAVVGAVLLSALLGLGLRLRGAGAVERKQLQWVLVSLVTAPLVWMVGNGLEGVHYWVGQYTAVASFVVGPLGFTLALHRAITRHDLYGLGRLVSRTLGYAAVTGGLVLTYLGLVLALGSLARAVTGESGDLVVALSTLGVAAVAQPLRRRVATVVDRRFNRARYDAARTIDGFGRGLRDEVSLDAIVEDLRGVATTTFHPIGVGVVLTGAEAPR